MSNATHTPGPWSVPHFAEPDVNCECSYVLCDHLMGAVASVYCSGEGADWKSHGDNPKFAEACANAHLIAAAPDLLAALKKLAASHLATIEGEGFDPEHCVCSDLDDAFAAIAKAEGRS